MVRQHGPGRRPQRDVHAGRPPDPPLAPCAGGGHVGRRYGCEQRSRPLQGAQGRGLRRVRTHWRALRRHQGRTRRPNRALGRGPLRLGHLRMAARGCVRPGLPRRHSRQLRRAQGPPWREPSGGLAVRRVRGPLVPACEGSLARVALRGAAPPAPLCDDRLPRAPRRARDLRHPCAALRRRPADGRQGRRLGERGDDGRHPCEQTMPR